MELIEKPEAVRRRARMPDYARARRTFTWAGARAQMSGLPGGRGLNIAHEAVDRHATGRGDAVALRVLSRDGAVDEVTYAELRRRTDRFANALRALGVARGERVFTLLPRTLDLYVVALGTLKAGCVLSPLFSAFGPEPVAQRLRLGEGRVLATTPRLYERRVRPQRADLPDLRHVLLTGDPAEGPDDGEEGCSALQHLLDAAEDGFTIPPTDPEDPALLHFTSGTTGRPKGAVHVHEAAVAHHATATAALDLGPDDVFWCTADPGWVTGTSYGIVAPLTHGATLLVDERDFDAERWYDVLAEQRVTVWYTAPTALRMLARHGAEAAHRRDLSALRHVASVGEPLNAEVVRWSAEVLGTPVHDNWWQTETGAIMISNFAGEDIRPGSMGRPLPGIEATVLERGPDGRALRTGGGVREVTTPGVDGELALRVGWPSLFRGYLHEDERYRASFADGWYLTGDVVRRDADGWYWFAGRADDVIKTAGHLVGPFEVESVLMAHPAVAEAAVIGKPDPVAGELVKAFVTLRPGWWPSDALHDELIAFARRRLGSVAPKELVVDPHLPHTRSGKILRRLLKARELGLPEGDLSTVETS
ncbi:acetate--CoA ligase [Actinomycetospora cinnamomea]|uniref:acetate--CoA ligase n=1 Tax=Actinomycetospora cinnamomea TaxID=663609 RepID=A0A2U1F2I1_9PSEU|nr:acetate--CoA ligase [Actinomycetospora cinnamomea]PVZ06339.1 acetyl-CoA synthetase [Actinomycetospora cinnamomea]